jgi:hypothetical protein
MTGNKSAASSSRAHSSSVSRAFDLKTDRHDGVFELLHGIAEGEGSMLVDPGGEGFEVGEGAVDRAVGKSSATRFLDFAAQGLHEVKGQGNAESYSRSRSRWTAALFEPAMK